MVHARLEPNINVPYKHLTQAARILAIYVFFRATELNVHV